MSKQKRLFQKITSLALSTAIISGLFAFTPLTVSADEGDHIPDEFKSDIGVYTNGEASVKAIGYPTYTYMDETAEDLKLGVDYTAESQLMKQFWEDYENGATDYYVDRVLAQKGSSVDNYLMTRGRSLWMREGSTHNTMGFAGQWYSGGANGTRQGNLYTISISGQSTSAQTATRYNAPSHFAQNFTVGSTGVTAEMKKFISWDNVAGTVINFVNNGSSDQTFTLVAASPTANAASENENELIGYRAPTSSSNNGLTDLPVTDLTVRLKGDGFALNGTNLERTITIPAGESVAVSVMAVVYNDGMPEAIDAYEEYAAMEPMEAFSHAVTDYNYRFADDFPYIDVPDVQIAKSIMYRWWLERYNTLDLNEAGYVYQYPITVEGANLYTNSIVLTQPMHIQDTKWQRNPYYAYGSIMNVGELSGSSAFLDSPGNNSWNNHYSQYIGTAGLEAYYVHGGGEDIAERFAYFFEWDGIGQLEHYDGDGDMLIGYNSWWMPGNDGDALTFSWGKSNGTLFTRPESAYVWGDFDAASQLYSLIGQDEKADEMQEYADTIQEAIIDTLWNDEMEMFLAATTPGGTVSRQYRSGYQQNPLSSTTHIPVRESNLYDVYAQNLIPAEDWETYVNGFRFLTYGDNFPIFPFYTGNQYDRTAYGMTGTGSNNYSNINFTVMYRAVRSALRYYDPEHKWIDGEYVAQLLDWLTWSVTENGDLRHYNQSEHYTGFNFNTWTIPSSNRYSWSHVMLGNMNYIFIEDMGGILPRADDSIELWPIDLGYEYFMVNNLRYHNNDITIVWDEDGSQYGLGAGYSLFINGERVASADKLGRFVYNPNTNTIEEQDDDITVTLHGTGTSFPDAVNTVIEDNRIVSYLKTAGIDLEEENTNLALDAELSSSYTQQGTRNASWRNFHTPGRSGQLNYHANAISEQERPVSIDAITDGVTVNEPYWGNYGTTEEDGYIVLDFGREVEFDNVKVWFVSDRQPGGYKEPQRYSIQVMNDEGEWQTVPDTYKDPKVAAPKFNEALFETQTTDKVRIYFVNYPDHYTAISEIQVFNSGREVPEVVNDAPNVRLEEDTTMTGNLMTGLVATVTDDGVPEDVDLIYKWSVEAAPEGATATVVSPNALATRVVGTASGEYTFKFVASDTELETERFITVTLTELEDYIDFAPYATITHNGSSSWENHLMTVSPTNPSRSNPGTGQGWGTWESGTGRASNPAWIQYSWDSPIRLDNVSIYWYDDNGGTRAPTATTYAIEYSNDGENWTGVTLKEGSSYAGGIALNQYNVFEFEQVVAAHIRVRIYGLQGAGTGTGILRFRTYGYTVNEMESPVIMRVLVDEDPGLPEALDGRLANGDLISLGIDWQEVTEDALNENLFSDFSIVGTNGGYGMTAIAQLYVRAEASTGYIGISGVTPVERTIFYEQEVYLPKSVHVSYNDGSYDNQANKVDWHFDPDMIDAPGEYVFEGDIISPDYVVDEGRTTTYTLRVDVSEDQLWTLWAAYIDDYEKPATVYTANSYAPFKEAFEAVEAILEDYYASTFEERVAAYIALSDAGLNLKVRAENRDNWYLEDLVAMAENDIVAVGEDFWTADSYDALINALEEAYTVLEVEAENRSRDDVVAVTEKLEYAYDNIEMHPAPAYGLLDAIELAEAILEDGVNYIPVAVETLKDAIAQAKLVAENRNRTPQEVADAIELLGKATAAMFEAGDKEYLEYLIWLAESRDASRYTPNSWAEMQEVLEDAYDIYDDPNATVDEVDEICDDLYSAIMGLVQRANKASLALTIGRAEDVLANADDYAPISIEGLDTVLEYAKGVYDNDNASQAEVNEADSVLTAKLNEARFKANVYKLQKAIGSANAIDLSVFTMASARVLMNLVVEGEEMLNDPNVLQNDVDAKADEITKAITGLVAKPVTPEPPVDPTPVDPETPVPVDPTPETPAPVDPVDEAPAPQDPVVETPAANDANTAKGGNNSGTTLRRFNSSANSSRNSNNANRNADAGKVDDADDADADTPVADANEPDAADVDEVDTADSDAKADEDLTAVNPTPTPIAEGSGTNIWFFLFLALAVAFAGTVVFFLVKTRKKTDDKSES